MPFRYIPHLGQICRHSKQIWVEDGIFQRLPAEGAVKEKLEFAGHCLYRACKLLKFSIVKDRHMARVTVEDCIDKVDNRFELVLLASHRARLISQGASITVDRDNDKNPVVALREIADETLSPGDLKEDLIHSLQKHVEVDEPEPDPASLLATDADTAFVATEEDDDQPETIAFDRMSEEELLAGIEGLVPPEKSDDF